MRNIKRGVRPSTGGHAGGRARLLGAVQELRELRQAEVDLRLQALLAQLFLVVALLRGKLDQLLLRLILPLPPPTASSHRGGGGATSGGPSGAAIAAAVPFELGHDFLECGHGLANLVFEVILELRRHLVRLGSGEPDADAAGSRVIAAGQGEPDGALVRVALLLEELERLLDGGEHRLRLQGGHLDSAGQVQLKDGPLRVEVVPDPLLGHVVLVVFPLFRHFVERLLLLRPVLLPDRPLLVPTNVGVRWRVPEGDHVEKVRILVKHLLGEAEGVRSAHGHDQGRPPEPGVNERVLPGPQGSPEHLRLVRAPGEVREVQLVLKDLLAAEGRAGVDGDGVAHHGVRLVKDHHGRVRVEHQWRILDCGWSTRGAPSCGCGGGGDGGSACLCVCKEGRGEGTTIGGKMPL